MTTITEAFDLPRPEDIRAMGFVVKLREADAASAEVKQLVTDYVVTPAVEKELPRILDDMKQVFDRGEEYGRFIHGSFGSGKSHFMTILSLLIEGAEPAWAKLRPLFAAHRQQRAAQGQAQAKAQGGEPADHEAWLAKAGLLVVRLHMLSVRGKTTGLDRAVYDGFNAALKKRGKAPFEFLHVDGVFDEVRREAKEYGDVVWKRLEAEGVVGGQGDFEALASGSPAGRERFARAWLAYKGRDAADAGVDPRWSEGLHRMTAHAKAQGFGGVVLLIDEFLLWLAEKSGQEFVREINDLNVIVDHTTGQRPLPVFVFVARQRNLQEFFPDLVDESKIHEHIDHHAKRFELTKLQDVELRHIVKGRVLRPKLPAEVQAAIDSLAKDHEKILPALLEGGDLAYLRDVYPFHPALIAMLVDVTSLMQRERSALRLLYELLVLHQPNLPLGQFLPVGSAFAAIFPEAGVEASQKVELMQDIHHQYYARIAPTMARLTEENPDLVGERRRALDQLVKTVLLAEVSPKLKQGGLTVERLVQLNSVDVEGETFRSQVRVAETDLLALSRQLPDLQIAGTGKTAIVRYVLGRVSLGEVIGRARSKVDNPQQRFTVFYAAVKKALGVAAGKGFESGGPNVGDYELSWRKTKRRGRLKIGNVREMAGEDFSPPEGAFAILVDYPWDEPGHTVDEDRLKAGSVRKSRGHLHTVCWLPRHMTPAELSVITELAAVRYLLSDAGQEDLLGLHGAQDRAKILEQAGVRATTLEAELQELLREVYIHHGELFALLSDMDGSRPRETLAENLDHIAVLLMDRRYKDHPQFETEPKKPELELLLQWMYDAGQDAVSVGYDDATGKVLKSLAKPLEIANIGQTKASLRLDGRILKDVLTRADQPSVSWTPIAEHLRDTYGLQPLLVDLFLCFLCRRDHRAIGEIDASPIEARLGMPTGARIRLERGKIVEAAEWHRLRDLGADLFGEAKPTPHRSLQSQDRFAAALQTRGRAKRLALQGLHARLVHLGVGLPPASGAERLAETADANQRLAALETSTTDSHAVLTKLLASWSDAGMASAREVVQGADALKNALGDLNEGARDHLRAGTGHPTLGAEVADHLSALDRRLAGTQAGLPIHSTWIGQWNDAAQVLVKRLIAPSTMVVAALPPLPAAPPPPPPPAEPVKAQAVLLESRFDPSDADAVSTFLGKVRKALEGGAQAANGKAIRVMLVREDDPE